MMAGELKTHTQHQNKFKGRRRSMWRQTLIEVERGITLGFRSDSSFFVHFFTGCIVVTAGMVLGIELIQWTILVPTMTVVLAAEMFHSVLKSILVDIEHHFPKSTRQAIRMSTAAVFVTNLGAVVTIGLIFGNRLLQIFSG
ncbi:MAG: diacylglycerol kinase [Planctomycetes bacterium]|nr:diacylglycerol kinase [Planctomycetota bacterium]